MDVWFQDGTELQVFVAEVKNQIVGMAVIRHEEVNFCFCLTLLHSFSVQLTEFSFTGACWSGSLLTNLSMLLAL